MFKEALASEIHSASSVEYFVDADLTAMFDSYLRDLNAGKKVVLVSHSQGNFYANNAHAYITARYPTLGASMGVVAVATPASYVAGNGLVTQNSKDRIIFGIVSPVFNVVPANVSITGADLPNHGFTNTYMLKQSAKIVGDIQTTISRLSQPEVNPDCDDRIAEITTLNAKDVTDDSATLQGRLTDGKNVDAWLVYDKNVSNVFCNDALHDGTGAYTAETVIERSLTNLQSNTLYYARACAKGGTGGTKDGGLVQFITSRSSAQVSNLGAVSIGETTATLRGLLTSGTGVDVWFRLGLSTSSLSCNGSGYDGVGIYTAETTVTSTGTGMIPSTQYSYIVCAKGGDGQTNSSSVSTFTTASPPVPVLPCSNQTYTGGTEGLSVIYDFGSKKGTASVEFETYSIPDKIEIFKHNTGERLLYTPGFVSGYGFGTFTVDSTFSKVDVVVTGNQNAGTLWEISVQCP